MNLRRSGVIAFICLIVTACAVPIPGAAPAKLQTVSIGLVTPSAAHAPMLVALGRDYFKDEGLEVNVQQFRDVPSAAAALAAGSVDVAGIVPSVALFNGVARGLDTRVVSSLGAFPTDREPAAFVVRKDLFDSQQVKTFADLKGRKFALGGGLGGVQVYLAALSARPLGFNVTDFDIVDLLPPDALTALTSKAIDAAYLPDPFKTQAVQQGIGVPIEKPENVGHSPVATLYSDRFIAQNRNAANAVMVALVRAARDLQGDGAKSDENLASISKYTAVPLETLRAIDLYAYDPNLAPDTDTIMGMQAFFMANGQLTYTTPLPVDRLIDASFSEYAARKLGPYRDR